METPSRDFIKCTVCGGIKPQEQMSSQALRKSKGWRPCKQCVNEYTATWRDKNREKVNKYHREWRKPIQHVLNAKLSEDRKRLIQSMTEQELEEFRRKEIADTKKWNSLLKNEVFIAYGGWICACCGETEKLFLTIDHVNNNGSEQRKNGDYSRSSAAFYRWLRKNKFPDGYQVLCMNCNFGKHHNGGTCPHKVRCND